MLDHFKQVTRGHNIVADGWVGVGYQHERDNSNVMNQQTAGRTKPLIELRVRN